MSQFSEPAAKPKPKRTRVGLSLLAVGLVLLVVLAFSPSPYVIRTPGPSFDALGTTEVKDDAGETQEVDVISIDGADRIAPDAGTLSVMTVNVTGTPQYQPSWFTAAAAWLQPDKDVLPIEAYYPDGVTAEQRSEENAAMMTQSQGAAIAAALTEQGYEVEAELTVMGVNEDGPANGILAEGDVITAVGDRTITDYASLQAEPFTEEPTDVTVLRDGKAQTVTITPKKTDTSDTPILGILVQDGFKFPINVDIELGDVGGPSAGLIFTLATIDLLEEGDLTSGESIAGTGTMAADGTVGPIGGIRQKVHTAVEIDSDYFLAPEANCQEALQASVADEIPIYAIADLDEALATVKAEGTDQLDGIRTCEDALAANVPQV
ncbi:YlbL family protein [Gulosibacter molinativorax]|uniref:PDZ domain-containing protein n=1 Tax=Gulosibacter molinativorax TaxID=256821 RepID=A0ABT7C6D4_9MICO|nr:PDZ domain-containing protein [Gulosibacter molinativorax]MDJ1370590.1 PDZ domain-containing protein [Gulosibacter molinativorax]QUY61996.1 Lon protease 1 [Gulosibacter molinativorax]